MPLTDELERLNALHERGALTDEEFAQAKKRLLEAAATEFAKRGVAGARVERRTRR